MDEKMRTHIKNRLLEIEKEHHVEILYAVESGSRAWGFESTDSDYDVRFIYKHKMEWYLNILPKRDVIEYPIVDEYDYSGWDLKKTLFLLNKSNPVLFEWLRSPIVYKKNENAYQTLKQASQKYFSSLGTIYHYLNMATGNNREYLQGEVVKSKKYFYVLRPLLACMWIEKYHESPPMEFSSLLEIIKQESVLVEKITQLLKRKKSGIELGLEPRIDEIHHFVDEKIKYFTEQTASHNPEKKPPAEYLDNIFYELLQGNNKPFV